LIGEFAAVKKQAFVRWAIVLTVVLVVGGLWVATLLPDDTLYVAPDGSFSMRLPPGTWTKEKEKDKNDKGPAVLFSNKEKRAVLGVDSVISESQESFQRKSVPQMKKNLADILMRSQAGLAPLERNPDLVQGKKNDRGNPYLLLKALVVVGREEPGLAYLALASVWCQSKGKTVSLSLSGALQATSEGEVAEERVYFDKAIEAVVNSVE
jgi:hypothetical protein